jgi:hypothetical protein
VIVSGPNEQLDVDLANMQSLSKDNDGITYLLVAVDVLSRYTWVEPLKNKTAKEVERGLHVIFSIYHCLYGSIKSLCIISFHLIHGTSIF